MLYYEFKVGEQDYKLVLTTRDIVSLEKKIGCNPLAIFGVDGTTIPTVSTMVTVLGASLQKYQHNITDANVYDIFDAYLADGNTVQDFVLVILEIYKVSGLIKNAESEAEKN